MNLRSPLFERRLRRRVRQAIRQSRPLRRAYRRARQSRRLEGAPFLWLFLVVWCAGMLASLEVGEFGVETRLAVVALWFLGETGLNTRRLQSVLYGSHALFCLYHWPLTDAAILRVQQRAWHIGAGRSLLWYLPFGFALSPWSEWTISTGAIALGLILSHAVCARALAVHGEAWLPRRLLGHVHMLYVFMAAAVALALAAPHLGAALGPLVEGATWLPVFGWLNHVYRYGWLGGDGWTWTLLLPVAMVLWTLPWSWQRIAARFHLPEPLFAATASEGDAGGLEGDVTGELEPPSRGVTALQDRIRTRDFLAGAPWWLSGGWYERLAARWLTAREKLLVELLLGRPPDWTIGFWRGLRRAMAALVLVLLLGQYGGWVLVAALALGGPIALPIVGTLWPGLQAHPVGGVAAPPFALMPVGFREVTRLLMKLGGLRFLLGFPALVVLALGAAWKWEADPVVLAGILAKAGALALAGLPAIAVLQISALSNDTQRVRWRSLVLLLLPILLMAGAAVGLFWASGLGPSSACVAVVASAAFCLRWFYGRAWARGRFDLVTVNAEATRSF